MLLIPVEEVRNRDWSDVYGTVVHVSHHEGVATIKFHNGEEIVRPFGEEIEIQQGGR